MTVKFRIIFYAGNKTAGNYFRRFENASREDQGKSEEVYLYGLSVLHDGLQNPFHTGKSV